LFQLSEKEQKILRKGLDPVTPEGEASNAGGLFVKSARARGVGPYDFTTALAGDIDEESKQRIRKEGWQEGYANGAQAGGGINLQREQEIISEAYKAGFADGSTDGALGAQSGSGTGAGNAPTPDGAKTVLMYLTLAGLAAGLWLCMPHGPEVRRAQLIRLPASCYAPARHYTKHRHAAASISGRDNNS
jgi:hypothetical protein